MSGGWEARVVVCLRRRHARRTEACWLLSCKPPTGRDGRGCQCQRRVVCEVRGKAETSPSISSTAPATKMRQARSYPGTWPQCRDCKKHMEAGGTVTVIDIHTSSYARWSNSHVQTGATRHEKGRTAHDRFTTLAVSSRPGGSRRSSALWKSRDSGGVGGRWGAFRGARCVGLQVNTLGRVADPFARQELYRREKQLERHRENLERHDRQCVGSVRGPFTYPIQLNARLPHNQNVEHNIAQPGKDVRRCGKHSTVR